MIYLFRIPLACLCACFIAACGGSTEREEPPPVEDTAFGEMVGTMDRARGVQDTVDQQKLQTDRQIDAAEGTSEE